jgi:hypothetical protein
MEVRGEMGGTWSSTLRGERAILVATGVVLLVLLSPLAGTSIPPLSDYPNHLARVFLLGRLAEGAPVGPWTAQWAALPNLAVDVAGVALEPLLGLEGFGRAFIAATIVLHVLGCRALARELLGRPSWRGVIAGALVWSEPLLLGYASFAFGFALSLWALARIVRVVDRAYDGRGGSRDRSRDALVAGVLGLGVAVSHAAAAATLVAAALGFVAARVVRARRIDRSSALGLAAIVPPLAYVGAWWLRSASRGGVSRASPGMIARAMASPLTGLDARIDQASLAILAIVVFAALWSARPLAIRPGALVAACAFALLVAVFPSDVAGGIEVHGRFALGAWTLGLFAIDRRPSPLTARASGASGPPEQVPGRLVVAALAAMSLFVARTAALGSALRDLDRDARDIRALFAREVPEGATVGVAWFFPAAPSPSEPLAAADRVRALATLHIPTLAIVDRRAEVPTLYDLPGAQPIRYEGVLPRRHRYAHDAPGPRAVDLLAVFEVVWLCGGPPDLAFELAGRARFVGRVGRCALYRRNAVADIASSAASIAPSSSATSSSAASCSASSLPRTVVSSMRASTRRNTSAMRTPSFDAGSTLRSASTVVTRATAGASEAASAASAPLSLSFTRASDSLSLPAGVSCARRRIVHASAPSPASTARPSAPCTAGFSKRPTAGA